MSRCRKGISTAATVSTTGIDSHFTAARIGAVRPGSGSRRMASPPKIAPKAATTKVIVTGTFGSVELSWSGYISSGISVIRNSSAAVDEPQRDGAAVGDRLLRVARGVEHDAVGHGIEEDHDDREDRHEEVQEQDHDRLQRHAVLMLKMLATRKSSTSENSCDI